MKISVFPFEVVNIVMQNLRCDVQDKNAQTNFVASCLFYDLRHVALLGQEKHP